MAPAWSIRDNRAMIRLAVPLLLWMITLASPVAGATPDPACSELHPTTGPGGLDLALLCTADRVRGAYGEAASGSGVSIPPGVIAAIAIGGLAVSIAFRLVASRAGQRLAPAATPATWWVCVGCHSFNTPEAAWCYACRAERTPDVTVAPTASEPRMDQRFGRPDDGGRQGGRTSCCLGPATFAGAPAQAWMSDTARPRRDLR